ncbi:MAG: hypothetical protein ACRBF0_14880 [Calditrichia bacterium]
MKEKNEKNENLVYLVYPDTMEFCERALQDLKIKRSYLIYKAENKTNPIAGRTIGYFLKSKAGSEYKKRHLEVYQERVPKYIWSEIRDKMNTPTDKLTSLKLNEIEAFVKFRDEFASQHSSFPFILDNYSTEEQEKLRSLPIISVKVQYVSNNTKREQEEDLLSVEDQESIIPTLKTDFKGEFTSEPAEIIKNKGIVRILLSTAIIILIVILIVYSFILPKKFDHLALGAQNNILSLKDKSDNTINRIKLKNGSIGKYGEVRTSLGKVIYILEEHQRFNEKKPVPYHESILAYNSNGDSLWTYRLYDQSIKEKLDKEEVKVAINKNLSYMKEVSNHFFVKSIGVSSFFGEKNKEYIYAIFFDLEHNASKLVILDPVEGNPVYELRNWGRLNRIFISDIDKNGIAEIILGGHLNALSLMLGKVHGIKGNIWSPYVAKIEPIKKGVFALPGHILRPDLPAEEVQWMVFTISLINGSYILGDGERVVIYPSKVGVKYPLDTNGKPFGKAYAITPWIKKHSKHHYPPIIKFNLNQNRLTSKLLFTDSPRPYKELLEEELTAELLTMFNAIQKLEFRINDEGYWEHYYEGKPFTLESL